MMQNKKNKVGIIILTYNRSDVFLPCLDSLALAKNNIDFELYVIDNNSNQDQYTSIKAKFDNLNLGGKIKGTLFRSDINTGFPGGNNIGIKHFLDKNDITHICLLNSDVIVTDFWLDRLVLSGCDAVGPVTNACGNEQTIPVPFN